MFLCYNWDRNGALISLKIVISVRGEVRGHKTSLTQPLFIEVPLPSQGREWSYICVLGVSSLHLSTIVFIGSYNVVLFVFHFIFIKDHLDKPIWYPEISYTNFLFSKCSSVYKVEYRTYIN